MPRPKKKSAYESLTFLEHLSLTDEKRILHAKWRQILKEQKGKLTGAQKQQKFIDERTIQTRS